MRLFGIYAGLIVFASLLGILIWIYGKQIRAWSAGTVETGIEADSSNPTETVPKEVQTSDSQASVGCGGLIEGIQMSSISKSPYAIRKSRH